MFPISLFFLSLLAAYYLFFLLFAFRIITWTQVYFLQRHSTIPPPDVISSHSLTEHPGFYPFLPHYNYTLFWLCLIFLVCYSLSPDSSRPHQCHLALNTKQLKGCLAQNIYLRKCWGWGWAEYSVGQMNNE